jgi:hypothetical protein
LSVSEIRGVAAILDLSLRPTLINGNRYADDYVMVWRSPQFGRRSVGRIRKGYRDAQANLFERSRPKQLLREIIELTAPMMGTWAGFNTDIRTGSLRRTPEPSHGSHACGSQPRHQHLRREPAIPTSQYRDQSC